MAVIKNRRTKSKVANTMKTQEPITGLPGVSSADNGMVLSVVDGTWDKAEVPSESPLCVVATGTNENAISSTSAVIITLPDADLVTGVYFLKMNSAGGGHKSNGLWVLTMSDVSPMATLISGSYLMQTAMTLTLAVSDTDIKISATLTGPTLAAGTVNYTIYKLN